MSHYKYDLDTSRIEVTSNGSQEEIEAIMTSLDYLAYRVSLLKDNFNVSTIIGDVSPDAEDTQYYLELLMGNIGVEQCQIVINEIQSAPVN